MECLICGGAMAFFFEKRFAAFGLAKVDYWRCSQCGFTLSRTHADMTAAQWESLNHAYHQSYQGMDSNADDPRWQERLRAQASMLGDAARIGLLRPRGKWLDYACGDGKLSELVDREKLTLLKYDKYMRQHGGYLDDGALVPGAFDFVVTTSVFEHFTRREHFDAVNALVSRPGTLGVHTLVCEEVPKDPAWFYLLPVHCAFHTNRSMSLLFEQWGYRASVYNVEARLWLWFREPPADIQARVERANERPGGVSYILKDGFVDYWK